MSARETILGRIGRSLADIPEGDPERWDGPGPAGAPDAYRREAAAGDGPPVDLFIERVAEYRAQVVRCPDGGPQAIAEAVAAACGEHGAERMIVPPGVPETWLASGVAWQVDEPTAPVTARELDAVDGVLTGATVGIAETGTIALDHGPGQGRRALSLLPDLHVCVVAATQIVATVPEGLERLAAAVGAGRPITLISGPSATSDIELERVEGVHGPRRLVVLVHDG